MDRVEDGGSGCEDSASGGETGGGEEAGKQHGVVLKLELE